MKSTTRLSFVMMTALALSAAPIATAQQAQGGGTGTTSQGRATNTVTASGQGTTRFQSVNVRLELTIVDQVGTAAPVKKTITMLLADGFDGRVRSANVVTDPGASPSRYGVQLNADASVGLVSDDKVRARITVEYSAVRAGREVQEASGGNPMGAPTLDAPSGLNETVTVILANGKPTVITQSADPATDRKVTLEATATIVR